MFNWLIILLMWCRQVFTSISFYSIFSELVLFVALFSMLLGQVVSDVEIFYSVVIWLGLFFNLLVTMQGFVCKDRFQLYYEAECLSADGYHGWRLRLFSLWVVHIGICVLSWPLLSIFFQVDINAMARLLLLWVLLSPAMFLLWYCMRIMVLGFGIARFAMIVLMIPWLLPTMFYALVFMHSYSSFMHGCVLFAGGSIVALSLMPAIVDYVNRQSYLAVYL